MTQQISNYNQKGEIKTTGETKTLPSLFTDEGDSFFGFIIKSSVFHIGFVIFAVCLAYILAYFNINLLVKKPELKNKDIEFVLTMNEKEPINKHTKYRSDKNSQAGGIHDPNKKVSMPSPAPTPAPSPAPQPKAAPKAPPKAPVKVPKQIAKPVQTQAPKPTQNVNKPSPVQKPSKPAAPVQRPVLKPSSATPRPSMPKLASMPSSPFKVEVPKSSAPVGKGFSTSQGTASSGGQSGSGGSQGGGYSMPSPRFSTTRTASSAGSKGGTGGSYGGAGGYGTGNMGNPGPGNPKGAPGIDAIKSPQWGPYMRELESKIKRNWHPPKGDTSKRVVLLFKIGKKGELLSVRTSKSSNSPENDQAAIQAVRMSAPFRALPPEYTASSVEIEFTFDYNVLGASRR